MVDLLPMIDIVEGDPFNSDPYDPNLMGPEARMRYRNGEKLPIAKAKTPLVRPCLQMLAGMKKHVSLKCITSETSPRHVQGQYL
jgi:hypothetical protein